MDRSSKGRARFVSSGVWRDGELQTGRARAGHFDRAKRSCVFARNRTNGEHTEGWLDDATRSLSQPNCHWKQVVRRVAHQSHQVLGQ
jgi:hypothetical protein